MSRIVYFRAHMSADENKINDWANPPSETENEKCENAVSQISGALRTHFGDKIYFVRQGSHRNRTNVKLDSDIDIAVVHKDFHFPDTSFLAEADKRRHDAGFVVAHYTYSQFKNDVHAILAGKFAGGERKN